MKMRFNRNIMFYALCTLAMVIMIWFGLNTNLDFGINQNEGVTYPRGRVVEVISDNTTVDETGLRRGRQDLRVMLLTGENRGKIVEAQNILFIDAAVHARVGQTLVLFFEQQEDQL